MFSDTKIRIVWEKGNGIRIKRAGARRNCRDTDFRRAPCLRENGVYRTIAFRLSLAVAGRVVWIRTLPRVPRTLTCSSAGVISSFAVGREVKRTVMSSYMPLSVAADPLRVCIRFCF
ncbi:hypothetical protein [Parabacteroides distasonis]|uniref:YDG domain-containing protein n=1 Tax=Parabacteroides distasonis TaxID=823 RepID=A0A5C6KEL5_PARDI|nr:hypothetical protein [Parabacteroides distasonis]TWV61727.1 hypothetical protein FSA05_10445 [Parabacteroides distasonis]